MAAVYLFGAIFVLLVAYFAALEFQTIAEMKGHSEKKYFWWSFFVGFVGMLMVVALPDRSKGVANDYPTVGQSQPGESSQSDDLPDL